MLVEIARTAANPDVPEITADEAAAAARAVIKLFERWRLNDVTAREILGGLSARAYARWKRGQFGRISRDQATRLSLLLGIHIGVRSLYADARRGYGWMNRANDVFAGRSPVEVLAEGSMFSLARVRSYIDAELVN